MYVTAINWMLDRLVVVKLRLVRILDDFGAEILNHAGQRQDQIAVWAPANMAQISLATALRFEIPAGTTVATICFLDSSELATWALKTIPIAGRESYGSNGLLDVTAVLMIEGSSIVFASQVLDLEGDILLDQVGKIILDS
jgi:hypothetical protein